MQNKLLTQLEELQHTQKCYRELREERGIWQERQQRLDFLEEAWLKYQNLIREHSALQAHLSNHQEQLRVFKDQLSEQGEIIQKERLYAQQLEHTHRELYAELRELKASRSLEQEQAQKLMLAEQSHHQEQLQLLHNAKQQMNEQFKNLAQDILEEKSKRFSEQNQHHIKNLLEPVQKNLKEFHEKVDKIYVEESKDRTKLAQQVTHMMQLNQQMSEEARRLTEALKGSNKIQGSWGELILERVLESSGLRQGEEYRVQTVFTRDDGRLRPDVVIHLPKNRHILIDAKTSLSAYQAYYHAPNQNAQQEAIKAHIDSIRQHFKGLSDKAYQNLEGIDTLDFVVMFIPLDAAFILAVEHDQNLYFDAWKKNVLLVSPATLLFVIRTVAHLWGQEAQNKNTQEIANKGIELYEKISSFIDDFEKIGNRLMQAQKSYDDALKKITGRGGMLRKAEQLKALGLKPSKTIKWISEEKHEHDAMADHSFPTPTKQDLMTGPFLD